MFEKQGWHLLFLVLLLVGVALLARSDVLAGQLWGVSTHFSFESRVIGRCFQSSVHLGAFLFYRIARHSTYLRCTSSIGDL